MRLRFDSLSFWFGFIVASIFWWMVGALKPAFKEWRAKARTRREEAKLRDLGGLEEKMRQIILRQAQAMHLAANLFSLDEIVQTPRLLTPPPDLPPAASDEEREERDAVLAAYMDDISVNAVPYLPDWPEMGTHYGAPSLNLFEALQYGADLAIIARPGMGKTTALAWLASRLAQQAPDLPAHLENKTAFILHAANVLGRDAEDGEHLLDPLIEQINRDASLLQQSRFPDLVRVLFTQGRALLLFDGLDELPRAQADEAIRYLAALKKAYPETQCIAAADSVYLDGLIKLRFAPLPLRPWDAAQRAAFVKRWGKLWEEYIVTESWAQELPPHVDAALLNAWLLSHDDWYTPLEMTLRTWALYAGDIQGATAEDAIYTHLRRLLPEKTPFEALETLGLQIIINQMPVFQMRDTKQWLEKFESAIAAEAEMEDMTQADENADETSSSAAAVNVKPARSLVDHLTEAGLLVKSVSGHLRAAHPVFTAFLAGRAAAQVNVQTALAEQPAWSGQAQTLYYLAHYGNPTQAIQKILSESDSVLNQHLFSIGRWLKTAPANAAWRSTILMEIAKVFTKPGIALAQRGQAASALALSRINGIAQVFIRQLRQSDPEILQISALGLGLTQQAESVPHLQALFDNPNPRVYRAACLGLAAIGNDPALEALVDALLNYHDDLRQAAAEALANHVREGHPTLQDAAQREGAESAALRRAAVYGLARIHEPWADALLDQLQYDEEWVVRNGAVALLEARRKTNPFIPRPLTPPAQTSWLLTFAARQGLGISPAQDPTDILLQVLQYGEPEEKLAVLAYLRTRPSEGVIAKLYHALRGNDDIDLRESIYLTLFWMAASGVRLPSAKKYGLS